ncbi:MAG: hypothetical protein [Bacteriophage sp.]|nr:MAG: hypothetical protein [Bacteriophage sp.]
MDYLIWIGLVLLGYFLGCGMTLFVVIVANPKIIFNAAEDSKDKPEPWKNKNG